MMKEGVGLDEVWVGFIALKGLIKNLVHHIVLEVCEGEYQIILIVGFGCPFIVPLTAKPHLFFSELIVLGVKSYRSW